MANEQVVAETWLMSLLSGSEAVTSAAPGGVWSEVAPQGTEEIGLWVTFQMQSPGVDEVVIGDRRIMVTPLYLIVANGAVNDYGSLQAPADAIDAVIHGAAGEQSGYAMNASRESLFSLSNRKGTAQWRKLGGLYRLYIRQ